MKQGRDASDLADHFDVSITTVYNIRKEARLKGDLSFVDKKEAVNVPEIRLDGLPDDVEGLKRRC